MAKPNLSGCLTDKQIMLLNNRLPQLPFELGCALDEAFFKLLELIMEQPQGDTVDTEVLCYCDDTGIQYLKHISYDHSTQPATISITNTLNNGDVYTPVGTEKKAKVELQSETFEVIAGKQTISGDDTATQLFSAPADAKGAIVQIDTTCCVRACWDGTDPTNVSGYELGDGAVICLGNTPNSQGDENELQNFKLIAEAGCTYTATATFYK
jgi:hypothetical protein